MSLLSFKNRSTANNIALHTLRSEFYSVYANVRTFVVSSKSQIEGFLTNNVKVLGVKITGAFLFFGWVCLCVQSSSSVIIY